ncbi:PREDICTED: agamous-like MADS-box protein AGL61 [Ipomoea nil]|uniref:agamous-like MADS-box protein AGL61 n=1 Tax=Ipomoea nil TaxID=35883 RepID=UPI0009015205|nr:PREDICTED: agamous-like MADS-box protein AGL61 [Ipomoea nil]
MSSNNSTKRAGRGRQRIPLSRIENDAHRSVIFSQRRRGLIKKANEISTWCGVEMLLVLISPSGKAYTFSKPNMDTILKNYFGDNPLAQTNFAEQHLRAQQEVNMQIQYSRITDLEMQIQDQMKLNHALRDAKKARPPISDLPLSELQAMKHRIEMLRSYVLQAKMKVHAQAIISHDDVGPSGTSAL